MSVFQKALTYYNSAGIDQLKGPQGLVLLAAYQSTNKFLPYKMALASEGFSVTSSNLTITRINEYPLLASDDYTYRSDRTDAEQPLASDDYRMLKSLRLTATSANATYRINLTENIDITNKVIKNFKVVVKSPGTSIAYKVKLQSTPGVNEIVKDFTTSSTANTWLSQIFDPTDTSLDTGTVDRTAISSIEFEVVANGTSIDIYVYEAAQHADQITGSVISVRANICLTQDGYSEEESLETAMIKCFNNNKRMFGNGRTFNINIKTTSQNDKLDAFARRQVMVYEPTTRPEALDKASYSAFSSGSITLALGASDRLYEYAEYTTQSGLVNASLSNATATTVDFNYDASTQTVTAPSSLDGIKPQFYIKKNDSVAVYNNSGTDTSYIFELQVQRKLSEGTKFKAIGRAQMSIPSYTLNNGEPGDTMEYTIMAFADENDNYSKTFKQ